MISFLALFQTVESKYSINMKPRARTYKINIKNMKFIKYQEFIYFAYTCTYFTLLGQGLGPEPKMVAGQGPGQARAQRQVWARHHAQKYENKTKLIYQKYEL